MKCGRKNFVIWQYPVLFYCSTKNACLLILTKDTQTCYYCYYYYFILSLTFKIFFFDFSPAGQNIKITVPVLFIPIATQQY